MLLRVRVRVAVRAPACNGLRLWCFRLCFRLCFAHATIAPCASRCPKVPGTRLLLAPQASPHGAAGEPRKSPCYYALKPSRAPFSWARFSVSFSRSADLTFPIFTKPTTMDKKWQKLPGQFMDRSSRRCGRCGGWARPVLGAVAGADGLSDGSPVRIRPPARCAARHRCSQWRCARCSSWLDRRLSLASVTVRLPGRGHCTAPAPPLLIRPRAADRRCSGRAWRRQTARAWWISRATCSCAGAPRQASPDRVASAARSTCSSTARCPRLGRRRSSLADRKKWFLAHAEKPLFQNQFNTTFF
jgi:hypothetical protein